MATTTKSLTQLAALALALCGQCLGGTIYSTGYEAGEGYSLGVLSGQNGWDNSNYHAVQNSVVFSGSQAVSVTAALAGQIAAFQPLTYNSVGNPEHVVTMQTQFLLPSLVSQPSWIALAAFGSGFGFIGQVAVANGAAFLGLASSSVGSIALSPNVWYSIRMVLDFQNQTMSAYVNSSLLASGAFATTQTDLAYVVFGENGGGGANQLAYFDDLAITSAADVPEPGAFGLAAAGLAVLAASRARKSL